MKMKNFIIAECATVLSLFSFATYAATDYQCMNNCTADGLMYAACQSRCEYNQSIAIPSATPQLDSECYSNCTQHRFAPEYCRQNCTSYY